MYGVSSDALGPKYPKGRARPYGYVFNIRKLTATFRKDGVTGDDLQITPSEWVPLHPSSEGFCGASARRRSYDIIQT